jgi:hypothetical protein
MTAKTKSKKPEAAISMKTFAGEKPRPKPRKRSIKPVPTKRKPGRPKKRSKAGRPTVMTPEVVGKLETAFSIDCTVEEACFYAGIHRDTYHKYCLKNPAFIDRVDELRQKPVLKARQTLVMNLGDTKVAQWYMERKRKAEFSIRSEVTGADGGPVQTLQGELTGDRLRDAVREIMKLDDNDNEKGE